MGNFVVWPTDFRNSSRSIGSVIGISSVNPSHMLVAYNDARTVDDLNDFGTGSQASGPGLFAKVLDFFRLPWLRDRERNGDEGAVAEEARLEHARAEDEHAPERDEPGRRARAGGKAERRPAREPAGAECYLPFLGQ